MVRYGTPVGRSGSGSMVGGLGRRARRALARAAGGVTGPCVVECLEERRLLSFSPWIQNVRMGQWVDQDGDGFASEFTLEVDVDAFGSGEVQLFVERESFPYNSVARAVRATVDGQTEDWIAVPCVAYDTGRLGATGHGAYDLKVTLYTTTPYGAVDAWGSNHPVLDEVRMEYAREDHDYLPRITDVRMIDALDQDSDGYAQWRDIEVSLSSRIRGTAYVEILDDGFWSNATVATSPRFTIEPDGSITAVVRVFGDPNLDHDAYNLIVAVRGDDGTALDAWDANHPVLAAVRMERAGEDPLPVLPRVDSAVIVAPVDIDGDGYARSRKAVVQVSMAGYGGVNVYSELYAQTAGGEAFVGMSNTTPIVSGFSVPLMTDINAVNGVSKGTYDLVLKLYYLDGTLVRTYDKSGFPALAGVNLETSVEDALQLFTTMADVRRANPVDTDNDGYFEWIDLEVSIGSNVARPVYISVSPEGDASVRTTGLFTVNPGEQWRTIQIAADPDLSHGLYDMTVRVHDENDNILDTRAAAADADVGDVPMELPSEQSFPVAIQGVRRAAVVDEDEDGFYESIDLEVNTHSPGSAWVYLSVYPDGGDTERTSPFFMVSGNGDQWHRIRIPADPELVHGQYDLTLSVVDWYQNILDEWTGAQDANLSAVPLELFSEVVIPDDALEVNGGGRENDYFEDATDLGRLTAARVDADLRHLDEDWYVFTTARTSRSENTVRIDFDPAGGNLNLEVYDVNQEWIEYADEGIGYAQFALNKLPAATYYIRVFGDWNRNYTLTINAPSDADDRLEVNPASQQNDTLATAYEFGQLTGLRTEEHLNFYDEDWYGFSTARTARDDNFIRIDFDAGLGPVYLELYNDQGDWIENAETPLNFQQISLSHLPPGIYYARVHAYFGDTNPDYALTINAPLTEDDTFEQNDDQAQAAPLGTVAGPQSWSNLMFFDEDWFSFTTTQTARTTHFVGIDFQAADGNIDLELHDAEGNYIDVSDSTLGHEQITLDRLAVGTYFVRVYAYFQETNPDYTLVINAPTGQDDAYEQNDDLAHAASLGAVSGLRQWDSLNFFDEDYYSFTIAKPGGAGDLVRIDYSLAAGDIELELLDTAGEPLGFSENASSWESISLDSRPAGKYYVRAYAYFNITNPDYTLSIIAPVAASDYAIEGTGAADTFTVRLDNLGEKAQVFTAYPVSGLPGYEYPVAALNSLTLNALGGDDRLFVDFSNGNPLPAGGVMFNGGEGEDTVTVVGTRSSDDLVVDPGQLVVGSGAVLLGETEQVALSGDGAEIVLDSLVIGASALLRVGGVNRLLRLNSLVIQGGTLDLVANDMLLAGGDVATVEALIAAARNGGKWDRAGLTSSAAGAVTTLGVIAKPEGVLVKYTYYGDVNGDGAVNLNDYFVIDSGYLGGARNYANGDVNFDGGINLNDYFLIDSAYLGQSSPLSSQALAVASAGRVSKVATRKQRGKKRKINRTFSSTTRIRRSVVKSH